jgi:carboxyl-terminal processing protease
MVKFLSILFFTSIFIIITGCNINANNKNNISYKTWETTPEQKRLIELTVTLTTRNKAHYSKKELNAEFSKIIIENFFFYIDPTKWFFSKQDMLEFNTPIFQREIAINLDKHNIDFVWHIGTRFKNLAKNRLDWVNNYLLKLKNIEIETYDNNEKDRRKIDFQKKDDLERDWEEKIKKEVFELVQNGVPKDEAIMLLQKHYFNWNKFIDEIDSNMVLEKFLVSFMKSFDPHADYFTPIRFDSYENKLKSSFEGIGISTKIVGNDIFVEYVYQDGPASQNGNIKKGDRIVFLGNPDEGPMIPVDHKWINRLSVDTNNREKTKDKSVFIGFMKPDKTINVFNLKIKTIVFIENLVKYTEEKIKINNKELLIGVIQIPSFYVNTIKKEDNGDEKSKNSSDDVFEFINIAKTNKVDGLMIDLRQNNGGVLDESLKILSYFVDGPLLQKTDAYENNFNENDKYPGVIWNGPLTVFISKQSASSSEILAAGLQDYGVGLIVGEHSFGKGTFQTIIDFDQYTGVKKPIYGQAKITVGEFHRVSGEPIQVRGIMPDVYFPITWGAHKLGENQLKYHHTPQSINSANYQKQNSIEQSTFDYLNNRLAERGKIGDFGGWISFWNVHQNGKNANEQSVPPNWPTGDIWTDEALKITADYIYYINNKSVIIKK